MLFKNVQLEQSRSQLATELMLYHMQVSHIVLMHVHVHVHVYDILPVVYTCTCV